MTLRNANKRANRRQPSRKRELSKLMHFIDEELRKAHFEAIVRELNALHYRQLYGPSVPRGTISPVTIKW